jgi:transposase-like protein
VTSRPNTPVPRKGTSVIEFFDRFTDERACLHHIHQIRWGDHSPCPRCQRQGRWFWIRGSKKYQHACRKQVSVLENTVFYRSNLSLMAWFYAMLLLCNSSIGVRSSTIRKQLGIGVRSNIRMVNLIRLQMAAYDRPEMLGGAGKTVAVDELLIRSVRHDDEKGRPNQMTVMGFSCEDLVLTGIVADRKQATMLGAIERFVRPGSLIVSDGHASYKRLRSLGWKHVALNHAQGIWAMNGISSAGIEAYWNGLKRTLSAYRMIYERHLWLYLAEAEFRYNNRRSALSNFDELTSYFADISGSRRDMLRKKYDWRE